MQAELVGPDDFRLLVLGGCRPLQIHIEVVSDPCRSLSWAAVGLLVCRQSCAWEMVWRGARAEITAVGFL